MKKVLCMLLVLVIVLGCSGNKGGDDLVSSTPEDDPQVAEKIRDFSDIRDDLKQMFGDAKFEYDPEAFLDVIYDELNGISIAIAPGDGFYGENLYSLDVVFENGKKDELPDFVDYNLVCELINTMANKTLTVEELKEFIEADGKKYRSEDFDKDTDLVNKVKGKYKASENTLEFIVYKDNYGFLTIIGGLKDTDFFDMVGNAKRLLETKKSSGMTFTYSYYETINFNKAKVDYYIELKTADLEDIEFEAEAYDFSIQINNEIKKKAEAFKSLDIPLFSSLVNYLNKGRGNTANITEDLINEFLTDKKYDDNDMGLIYFKTYEDIPVVGGYLLYLVDESYNSKNLDEVLQYSSVKDFSFDDEGDFD